MLVAAGANDDGFFPEMVWQKPPVAFMRSSIDLLSKVPASNFDNHEWKCLFIENLKNCNVTQVNRI